MIRASQLKVLVSVLKNKVLLPLYLEERDKEVNNFREKDDGVDIGSRQQREPLDFAQVVL